MTKERREFVELCNELEEDYSNKNSEKLWNNGKFISSCAAVGLIIVFIVALYISECSALRDAKHERDKVIEKWKTAKPTFYLNGIEVELRNVNLDWYDWEYNTNTNIVYLKEK